MRAFIAKGRTSIRLVAQDDPGSPFDDASPVPTSLGTGEALVTERSEKGLPTPLARTMMAAPRSRMGTVSDAELAATVATSAPAAT